MRNLFKISAKPMKLLIGITFSLTVLNAKAQTQVVDSTKQYTKVMIVPFEERMYFSDSDKRIAEKSKMNQTKVRRSFRTSLVETLSRDLERVYGGVYEVNPDEVDNKESDITQIYRSIAYKPEKRKPQKEEKPVNEVAVEKLNNFLKKKEAGSDDPMKFSGMNSLLDKDGYYDYMNISVTHPATLKAMKDEHGTDLFLFINQFEIKTNSRTCIDAATGLYERNFIVHYSVFNSDGKQLAGDMLVFPYHNNESRIKMMVYHMFGEISAGIIATMPTPYKITNATEDTEGDDEDEEQMPATIGDMLRRD